MTETVTMNRPNRANALYQRIEAELLTAIETGALSPANPVLEAHLADRLGVSRAPVRTALARLAARGVIRKRPGRGFDIVGENTATSVDPAADTTIERFSVLGAADRRPAWEDIYSKVERDIVSQQMFGAARVTEQALADHFSVSRTVAREVLARLQEVGIVEKDERMRWIAPKLTPGHIFDLYEMRWILEPVALRKAALAAPPDLLQEMRRKLVSALDRYPDIPVDTLDRLEYDLHVSLLSYCQNAKIIHTLTKQRAVMISHHYIFDLYLKVPAEDPFIAEHLAIVDQVLAGEINAAGTTLADHLRNSVDRALSRIETISSYMVPPGVPYIRDLKD